MPNLRGVTAGAAIVGAGYMTWLLSDLGRKPVILLVDGAGLIAFALFGAVCGALAASWADGRDRAAWVSLAVGCAGWAAGGVLWTLGGVGFGETAFPPPADDGYALFLAGVGLCLVFLLADHPAGSQFRLVLDALIVGAAVFGAAWVTLLEPVYAARAASPLATTLALAHPTADIALLSLSAVMLIRASAARRAALAALTAGLLLITVSDIAFAVLSAADRGYGYRLVALGWASGFLCLGFAALLASRTSGARRSVGPPSRTALWLPYVPVAVAAAICTPALIPGLGPVHVAAMLTLFAVMVRQVLVVADNRRLQATVADRELHDPLTGLANRVLFQDRLSHAVQPNRRHCAAVAVLVMDLDRFDSVNDDFGHAVGDAILVRVAERLATAVRSTDTVARIGGDEFAVLIDGDAGTAAALAQRTVEAFERPFVVAGHHLRMHPSIGLAIAPADGSHVTGDELLHRAGVAMNTAKLAPSESLVTFTPELDPAPPGAADPAGVLTGHGSARLLQELRHAIEHIGLTVVYQPKFDMRSNDIVGLEALVRWPHPRRGMLAPHQFLPLVRRHGLMQSVTSVVLELALDDAARWHDKGIGVPVAVNVFAPAVSDPGLPEQIIDGLASRGLPPESLTVEITEDLVLDNLGKTRMVFKTLRDKGIRVAIDDFGSGYSALWYLREFPVDEVKLDREFIASILTHPPSAAIVRAVVDLAHALGITPVAEGVENSETARQLLKYGCQIAQGFHFSPPLPAAAIEQLLESQKRGLVLVPGIRTATEPGEARSS